MKKTTFTLIDSIANLKNKIKRFANRFNDNFQKPDRCELCGEAATADCLNWHSWYLREVITMFGKFRIWVKRVSCKSCGHTFVILPEFVRKWCRYAKDIIKAALIKLRSKSCLKVSMVLNCDAYVSHATLYRWKKKYILL